MIPCKSAGVISWNLTCKSAAAVIRWLGKSICLRLPRAGQPSLSPQHQSRRPGAPRPIHRLSLSLSACMHRQVHTCDPSVRISRKGDHVVDLGRLWLVSIPSGIGYCDAPRLHFTLAALHCVHA